MHRIGRRDADAPTQFELLEEAERNIQRAERLHYDDLSEIEYKKGWIADERNEYSDAIAHYQKAIQKVKKWEREVQYRYDFACTLAKKGKGEEAIAQLKKVAKERWAMAEIDPDFANLRTSPQNALFEALIAEGKQAAHEPT
jgi:tetratricopeptide (TPR) repeat protein